LAACAAERRAVEAAADRRADRAQHDARAGIAAVRDAARVLMVAAKRAAEQELQLAGSNFKVYSPGALFLHVAPFVEQHACALLATDLQAASSIMSVSC
jgi:hypothetical protein